MIKHDSTSPLPVGTEIPAESHPKIWALLQPPELSAAGDSAAVGCWRQLER